MDTAATLAHQSVSRTFPVYPFPPPKISPNPATKSHLHHTLVASDEEANQCAPPPRLGCSRHWRRYTLSWRVEQRRSSRCPERKPQMADALLLPRRILAPSTAAASSSASSPPPPRWALSLASPRGVRLAAAQPRPPRLGRVKIHAVVTESGDQPKWWEKNVGPNMIDIHSTQEFLDALKDAGDRLVIVEFYGTWCGSCRALFPRLCRTALENPDILFLKVNFDENKPMCKRLNVKVLPFFHFYRGSDGQLEAFSCSLAKFQKLKDAIAVHNTARCSIGPPAGVGDVKLLDSASPQEKPAEASSR